ncbi:MAG: ABC transporter ATP-binding protein [Bacillota bacterium]|nr:ABC transporter ATP-binding protein [Bacillota bacterium]
MTAPSSLKPRLSLKGVSLTYQHRHGETEALRDVSLTVASEEFVSIVGPSGCGKSSLLSVVAGLIRPTAGEVRIDGDLVERPTPKVGYMLQHDHLFPWRTILDNALLGLEVMGRRDAAAVRKVRSMLERYGLGGFERYYPRQLSGGMRQRVALVRTLATDPEVLLLDEPFASLDYQTRLALEDEIGHILREERKTVVLVTHDISEAIAMSDRVVVLSHRPGTVVAEHRIDLGLGTHSALSARNDSPAFRTYFAAVWKELDVHA